MTEVSEISVAKIGSPSSPILVQLKEYEGRRFVDVRRYYVDRETRELRPTKKGITLNARLLSAIRDVFDRSERAIDEWLDGTANDSASLTEKQMAIRQQAADQIARQARRHHVESRQWRSPTFFECESSGDETTVAFNTSHPFWHRLSSSPHAPNVNTDQVDVVMAMLVAYYQAKLLLDDSEKVSPAVLFETLEYEWGAILKNYSAAGK